MQTRRLGEGEFQATMTPKMHDVTRSAADALDLLDLNKLYRLP